jgi:hypothetical protein
LDARVYSKKTIDAATIKSVRLSLRARTHVTMNPMNAI